MPIQNKFQVVINFCSFRYLAMVTALASEADFVFIPEAPPSVDWKDKLCDKLEQARPKIISPLLGWTLNPKALSSFHSVILFLF